MNEDLITDTETEDDNNEFIPLDDNQAVFVKNNNNKPTNCLTRRLYDSYTQTIDFKNRLLHILGWRFILFLVSSQMISKGLLSSVVESVMLPLFKNVAHVDAATLQVYVMVVMIPWSVKPLIGLCSDTILVYGYNKRGWLIIGAFIGIISSSLLFATRGNAIFMVLCFTGINFEIALFDLLSEGKYSEIRKANPIMKTDISIMVNAFQSIGTIVAVSFVGTLSDHGLYFVLFALATVFCTTPLVPTVLGWLPEARFVNAKFIQFIKTEILVRERVPIIVVAFCGVSGIVTSLVTTLATPMSGLITSAALLVACLAGSWYAFPSQITAVAFYQVIINLSQPVMGTALDYFYTASPECVPDGPHFSFVYFVTVTKTIGTVLGLLGVFFYKKVLSNLRYRRVLIITTIFGSLAGLSDLFIVTRTNIKLGISDNHAYLFGEAILEPFLGMLNWIPINALISIAVKDGMEASSFAFIAGLANFARMVSELNGSIIFSASGINTVPGQCDFSALPWLVLLCHILMPLTIGICASFLLPDIKQDENLD